MSRKLMLLLLLVGVAALAAAAFPEAAFACNLDCARHLDPETGEFIDYFCTDGEEDECHPEGNTCWTLSCLAPVALLDEMGPPIGIIESCPLVNDGQPVFTPMLGLFPDIPE